MKLAVALTFIALMLAPALIAFVRKLKYRWVILILSLIPSWGIAWVAALVWAAWPRSK